MSLGGLQRFQREDIDEIPCAGLAKLRFAESVQTRRNIVQEESEVRNNLLSPSLCH